MSERTTLWTRGLAAAALAAALTAGSGCASSGRIGDLPAIATGSPSSPLVLIRVSSMLGAANSYYVALDGKDLFSIRSGEYTEFPVPAGEHVVTVKCFGGWSPTWKEDAQKFVAVPNQPNHFEISPSMPCAGIKPITAEAGKAAAAKSTFISPNIPSSKQ
jgi:hypothetical protein